MLAPLPDTELVVNDGHDDNGHPAVSETRDNERDIPDTDGIIDKWADRIRGLESWVARLEHRLGLLEDESRAERGDIKRRLNTIEANMLDEQTLRAVIAEETQDLKDFIETRHYLTEDSLMAAAFRAFSNLTKRTWAKGIGIVTVIVVLDHTFHVYHDVAALIARIIGAT